MGAFFDWVWIIVMTIATGFLLFGHGGLFRRRVKADSSEGSGNEGSKGA